ncbi:MAG TPA: hypothetical protein VGA13_07005 [Acidimicrobiales bacterium]
MASPPRPTTVASEDANTDGPVPAIPNLPGAGSTDDGSTSSDTTSGPRYSKLRVHVTSTSDWTSIDWSDLPIRARGDVETGDTTIAEMSGSGLTMRGEPPLSATYEMIVLSQRDSATGSMRIRKGSLGSATVTIDEINGEPVVRVGEATNDAAISPNAAWATVRAEDVRSRAIEIPRVDTRQLVLAFFYPWFTDEKFESGVWWEKPAGSGATDSPDAIARNVDMAASHGVDGFIMSWDGSDRSDERLGYLLDAAAERDFTVSGYLETRAFTSKGDVDVTEVQQALDRLLAHGEDPAYLRSADGRPVVFVYGAWGLTHAEWTAISTSPVAQQVDPYFVGDDPDPAFAFDGFHRYSPTYVDSNELAGYYRVDMEREKIRPLLDPEAQPRLWAASTSPGFNNRARNPLFGGYSRPRGAEGARYSATWGAALKSSPDWVLITSWNEWYEATHIAPGRNTGHRALNQTLNWSDRFRAS